MNLWYERILCLVHSGTILPIAEAREIAHYRSIKLHLMDYYLAACRNVKEVIGVRGREGFIRIMDY